MGPKFKMTLVELPGIEIVGFHQICQVGYSARDPKTNTARCRWFKVLKRSVWDCGCIIRSNADGRSRTITISHGVNIAASPENVMYCGVDWFCWVSPYKSSRLSRGSRWLSKTWVMRSLRWEQCWGPTCWVCFQETLEELFDDPEVFLTCDHPLKPQTLWNFQLTPENFMGWKMNLANSKLTEYSSVAGTGCRSARIRVRFHHSHAVSMGFRGLNIFQPNIGCRLK